jgi:diaminopimelate epimerase
MIASNAKVQCISYYKLEGAGNDFLVFLSQSLACAESEKVSFVRQFADRRLGLGCDQVLEVKSLEPLAIQIWNQDGSHAEMCANGARAFALLCESMAWIKGNVGQFALQISGREFFMQKAEQPSDGFAINLGMVKYLGQETLSIDCQNNPQNIPVHIVEAPNPHAVVFLGSQDGQWNPPGGIQNFNLLDWGPKMEHHPRFPNRTNVEFVWPINDQSANRVEAKVWERGSGATLSSGSGSVAVATATWHLFPNMSPIVVSMNGNQLKVSKNAKGQTLLAGPAHIVAKGEFYWTLDR